MRDSGRIRIRTARAADARMLAVRRYEFRRAYASPGERESEAVFVRRCAAWMRRALRDRRRWRCWVAVAANADSNAGIIGHVWLQTIDKVPNPGAEAERHAYITNLYVQPAFRGGIGQRLLAAAMDWCKAHRMDSVILWPTDDSRSLYARHGFGVSGDLLDARLTGPHLNESFRMRASRRPARIARSSATRRAVVR